MLVPSPIHVVVFFANIWPFLAVWITWGSWAQLLFALAAVLLLAGNAMTAINVHQPLWRALAFPLAISIFLYIQMRGLVLLLLRGGIRWRDTFYPLADLKANRI